MEYRYEKKFTFDFDFYNELLVYIGLHSLQFKEVSPKRVKWETRKREQTKHGLC